jgi:DNA polymerase I-like protein with 3'-5' exonuclease and polymerase domains
MKIIQTADLTPTSLKTETEKLFVYNGLDCCVTFEVLDALLPQLDNVTGPTYDFSRALQGPALDMQLRGVLVDAERKSRVISMFAEQMSELETSLERIAAEGLGIFGFNWRSNRDMQTLFYDRLRIPVIKKAGQPTVNREALEKMEAYFVARPIIEHIVLLRELGKKIGVLKTDIDPDGRMRTSYNICGTSTGRFSSSYSSFGTGTNLQNIEEILRSIFCADPGMKMAYLDEPQGESRVVGAIEWNLFKDGRYLDACEGGDLHTNVAKLCWPDLGWNGDPKADRVLAERPFYRHYDYRFMCKKIGHGTNYGGKSWTLSRQAKIDIGPIEDFQPKYFTAFPAHLRWHEWVRNQLQTRGCLTTLTGRRRWFFGRRDSDDTYREALAYDPQGSLADILNRGMLSVWRAGVAELLMQIHDAILIQYPEEAEDEILPRVMSKLTQHVPLKHDRTLSLVPDIKVGWNWGNWSAENPDGLKSYVPGDKRNRSPKTSILDRIIP